MIYKNMKKVPQKSFQSIIILLLSALGLFILYRYVKSLDFEIKNVKKNVESLNNKILNLQICKSPTIPQPNNNIQVNNEEEEDDDESIKHEEIQNMLKAVMNIQNHHDELNDENEEIEDNDEVEDNDETNDIEENEHIEVNDDKKVIEIKKDEHIIDIEDEIDLKPTLNKDSLMRKTNEELKNILKDLGLNTKGTKAELVEKILKN